MVASTYLSNGLARNQYPPEQSELALPVLGLFLKMRRLVPEPTCKNALLANTDTGKHLGSGQLLLHNERSSPTIGRKLHFQNGD